MAVERKWESIPPQTIGSNGGTDGQISVPNASLFKVKQIVRLFSDTVSPIELEVKRVVSSTQLLLGLKSDPIFKYQNLTQFLTADNAKISAAEQDRPAIIPDARERAVFEEEPTVALRTVAVDPLGNKYSKDNPLPIEGNVDVTVNSVQVFTKPFDYIEAVYPSPTQEIYTSKTGGASGVSQQQVTINYTDSTKKNFSNLTRIDL